MEAVQTLEQCLLNSWPSTRTVHCDGWVLRYAGGYTKRANSANALAPSRAFSSTLEKARTFYAAHDQPAIFRLTPLANPEADGALREHGFSVVDPTIVMSASINGGAHLDPPVAIDATYSNAWGGAYAAARGLTQSEMTAHARILGAIPLPVAYATWWLEDTPVAFGLGVLDHGWLGIFDIATSPSARRLGGASRVVSTLMHWGKSRGAHTAWLSVIAANAPAIALYEGFNFSERYRYHYRIA